MKQIVDVLIIGAGPGGYPAAIRAAQLGKKVVIVDKGTIGGECLNWGCIPSKALISAANFYHKINTDAAKMGINIQGSSIDVKTLQKWKIDVQTKLINGIKQLLKSNKVKTVIGTASFVNKNTVEVVTQKGEKSIIQAEYIILATGAQFISLPGFKIDENDILSAKGVLSLEKIPDDLLVIGGGVIGMELGTVYAKFGSKLTVVELLSDILPGIEPRMTTLIKRRLKELQVAIYTSSKAISVKKSKTGKLIVEIETNNEKISLPFDKILLTVGKKASTSDLKLSTIGVETDRDGFIITNNKQQTNVTNIYAIGDCTGMPFTAHKATKQGIVAAEVIAGLSTESDFKSINAGTIFTDPEIAFVGLSEREAKNAGFQTTTGIARFNTSGRALTHLETDGFVKVITESDTGIILGVQIIGPDASNLISEASLGLEMGSTAEDLGWTVHPHPTLPEMVMEAADTILGKAIHQVNLVPKKK